MLLAIWICNLIAPGTFCCLRQPGIWDCWALGLHVSVLTSTSTCVYMYLSDSLIRVHHYDDNLVATIDLINKSHSAFVLYPTICHSERKGRDTFLSRMVHCGIWDRCILGFVRLVYCHIRYPNNPTAKYTSACHLQKMEVVVVNLDWYTPYLKVGMLKCQTWKSIQLQ